MNYKKIFKNEKMIVYGVVISILALFIMVNAMNCSLSEQSDASSSSSRNIKKEQTSSSSIEKQNNTIADIRKSDEIKKKDVKADTPSDPEPTQETVYEEPIPYSEPVVEYVEPVEYNEPSYSQEVIAEVEQYDGEWDADSLRFNGVMNDGGTQYTWYSQNVLPGDGLTELNENGRDVDDNGYVVDADGYIACASNDYPIGTELDSPFGTLKVYDSGCASGTIDIYTDW